MILGLTVVSVLPLVAPSPGSAQEPGDLGPRPGDTASPQAVVEAAYAALAKPPGGDFDWARFEALHLPDARLYPATEQTGGEARSLTVSGFVEWVEEGWAGVDPASDPGFAEEQVHHVTHVYGDVATVFSTYEKRYWDSDEILGRGINAFVLVRREGGWRIASIAWDEEVGAGPVPAEFLPGG